MGAAPLCKVPVGFRPALEEAGLSPAEVLAAARLPSHLLDAPGAWVSTPDYFALWQAVRAVSADPDIGITLARSVKPELTEPLFLAIMNAADGAEAIDLMSKFKRLLEPQSIVVHRDARGQVSVAYRFPERALPPQVLVDAELACLVQICRRGTRCEELNPLEIHFRRPALDAGSVHAAFFRCRIRLDAPDNALVFDGADLTRPFLTFNPPMLQALLPYLNASTPRTESAASRVRSVIAERLRGQRPTLETIGKELAMSARSVQRLLKENGTSFRRLLDEVRNEHARGYLRATSFSDGEVSFLLGFEDQTSFYRAFRSWNGISPSEFRQRPRD